MGADERDRKQMKVTANLDASELTEDLRSFWNSEFGSSKTADTEDLRSFLQFVSGDWREALRVLADGGKVELAGVNGDHVFRLF